MYTHRGAYLNSLGEVLHSEHSPDSVYLWTLPMFHCNGWCTAWAVTAIGGRHVCLRAVNADRIWQLLDQEKVTHLNGAPPVLTALVGAEEAHELEPPLVITTAGAPPNPQTIAQCEDINARVVHVYGLTETYGPYSVCQWQAGWKDLEVQQRAELLSRQGVGMIQAERLRVVDYEMNDVPADGETMGEIVMRGNNVMKGYFEDDEATAEAFEGGWFHSGDLGVMQSDGYVRLMDRAKDVVVSGGENIATVEVEQALVSHGAVADAAVIGVPDEKWGERPKAFVVLAPGQHASEEEIIDHVRSRIAHYKAPDEVVFVDELPRNSAGKVQKFQLREAEAAKQARRSGGARRLTRCLRSHDSRRRSSPSRAGRRGVHRAGSEDVSGTWRSGRRRATASRSACASDSGRGRSRASPARSARPAPSLARSISCASRAVRWCVT